MLLPLRPTSGMLRPLRLKMGMLRLCATEEILWDFARPKEDIVRLCATQIRYAATLRDPCCDFARPKLAMLRQFATYVATLCDS